MSSDKRNIAVRFFGGAGNYDEDLQETLSYIAAESPTESTLIQWIKNNTRAESDDGIRRRLQFIAAIDLIDRSNNEYRLTEQGEEYLETDDPALLYKQLSDNVHGFDTILKALAEGPKTDGELGEAIKDEHPEFGWNGDSGPAQHRGWLQSLGYVERDGQTNQLTESGRDLVSQLNSPCVWIEKTQIDGREYKQDGELSLGNAIIAPSRDEGGRKRYETMREAEVGDVVLHLLQERHAIIGVSRIASDLQEDFEGPPDNRWSAEQRKQGGYKRELAGYVELDDPVDIYEDVLGNSAYEDTLQRIRGEHDGKIIYNKRLALNQGHYFTEAPSDFVAILADESADLSEKLHSFGVEIPESPTDLPDPVDSYDGITAALADIRERLDRSPISNWLETELTATVIADWSDVLTNVGPDSVVTPAEEVRFQQIRSLYTNNEDQLREDAAELGIGSLNGISKPETLFVGLLRDLQEGANLVTNVNQVKLKIVLNEEYGITEPTHTDDVDEDDEDDDVKNDVPTISHPLLSHLESLPDETPVRKCTAPPEYWLTALQCGTVSFEEGHRDVWEAVEPGEIAILHSRAEPGDEHLDTQPSGILGVGIFGEKTTKDELWWRDEDETEPFPYLVTFDRLFITSDTDQLDIATPIAEHSTGSLNDALDALTAGILDFETVEQRCVETNGSSFPAQGAHAVFRTEDGSPDQDRPRALLSELAGRLEEVGTTNAHADFDGTIPTDPLDDLYFPGDEKAEIVEQIEAALRTGKHIIFTGPPGTGKTEIARRVCQYLASEYPYLFSDSQLTTATADWSTFDTVGGYMPEAAEGDGEDLSFRPGVVLNRLKDPQTGRQENEPIVIDELNRADIDKAFGQLFTLLSGQSVQLPFTSDGQEIELLGADQLDQQPASHQYVVPEAWRIFATMNTYDKTSLYEMSYAFMRRFAFIRVNAPDLPEDDTELEALMSEYASVWEIETAPRVLRNVGRVWRAMNTAVENRAIGPAIVMDILSYVIEQPQTALEIRLTRAIISYIFPQLEGVPQREQIVRQLAAVESVDEDMLAEAATEMLQVSITSDE